MDFFQESFYCPLVITKMQNTFCFTYLAEMWPCCSNWILVVEDRTETARRSGVMYEEYDVSSVNVSDLQDNLHVL